MGTNSAPDVKHAGSRVAGVGSRSPQVNLEQRGSGRVNRTDSMFDPECLQSNTVFNQRTLSPEASRLDCRYVQALPKCELRTRTSRTGILQRPPLAKAKYLCYQAAEVKSATIRVRFVMYTYTFSTSRFKIIDQCVHRFAYTCRATNKASAKLSVCLPITPLRSCPLQ